MFFNLLYQNKFTSTVSRVNITDFRVFHYLFKNEEFTCSINKTSACKYEIYTFSNYLHYPPMRDIAGYCLRGYCLIQQYSDT